MPLLSFSIAEMLPSVKAGYYDANALARPAELINVDAKRQTIRRFDFESLAAAPRRSPYNHIRAGKTGHLWWKSRAPDRFKIGEVAIAEVQYVKIAHSAAKTRHGRPGGSMRFYDPETRYPTAHWDFGGNLDDMYFMARADGFADVGFFLDYFVPNPGDVFKGALIKW